LLTSFFELAANEAVRSMSRRETGTPPSVLLCSPFCAANPLYCTPTDAAVGRYARVEPGDRSSRELAVCTWGRFPEVRRKGDVMVRSAQKSLQQSLSVEAADHVLTAAKAWNRQRSISCLSPPNYYRRHSQTIITQHCAGPRHHSFSARDPLHNTIIYKNNTIIYPKRNPV